VPTLFVGAVGEDAFATEAKAFYRREKMVCQLTQKRGYASGTAAILVDAKGQNQIVVSLGANLAIKKSEVPAAAIKKARVVVAQMEISVEATTAALAAGRRARITTVLNPAPMPAKFPKELLKHVDIFVPNETEFSSLMNQLGAGPHPSRFTEATLHKLSGEKLHALCRGLGVPAVIVTLGSKGCFISDQNGFLLIPAHTGIKVVDTTGAGDAFVGGLAAGLIKFNGDLRKAAHFGNAVAALSVTKQGTAPSMPHARDISRFLRSHS
jgi:ribokinase